MVANQNSSIVSLDDVIGVLDITVTNLALKLDREKIQWLNQAYARIFPYINSRIRVRDIDDAFGLAGERSQVQDLGNAQYFRSRELQLISLRSLGLSDEDIRVLEEIKRDRAAAIRTLSDNSNIGNVRLYLAAEGFNYLYVGIAYPLKMPYGVDFEGSNIIKIFYIKP